MCRLCYVYFSSILRIWWPKVNGNCCLVSSSSSCFFLLLASFARGSYINIWCVLSCWRIATLYRFNCGFCLHTKYTRYEETNIYIVFAAFAQHGATQRWQVVNFTHIIGSNFIFIKETHNLLQIAVSNFSVFPFKIRSRMNTFNINWMTLDCRLGAFVNCN